MTQQYLLFRIHNIFIKSYSFTSRGIGAGIYYVGGFYLAPLTDANLTQAISTQILGINNTPYAAHAFIVAGGPGSVAGGAGLVEIEVTGTSITDAGIRIPGDSEIIVADITALALNQFAETEKKWIGQVVFTLQNSPGATRTTFAIDFNYGFNKYEDFGNRDFILTDIECIGLAAASDSDFNIRILKQDVNNWLYDSVNFLPGGSELLNMKAIHGTENITSNNNPFAFKRSGLLFPVNGSDSEGLVVEIDTGQNNTVQEMNVHLTVET